MQHPQQEACRTCDGKGTVIIKQHIQGKTIDVKQTCPSCGGSGLRGYRTKG